MKLNHMFFYGAVLVIALGFGMFYFEHLEASKEIEVYSEKNQTLEATVAAQNEMIKDLTEQLSAVNTKMNEQQDIVLKYNALNEIVDLDTFDVSQLDKANQISEGTPLDLESAVSLVKYADQFDIPYSLVLSIIDLESNFTKDLVGTHQDRGYMQIIPETEEWLATSYGKELGLEYDPGRIFEPDYNLALGIKYLDILMSSNGSDFEKILSEYNRGPYNLEKYFALNKTYSTSYSRTVLSKERKYVTFNQR